MVYYINCSVRTRLFSTLILIFRFKLIGITIEHWILRIEAGAPFILLDEFAHNVGSVPSSGGG